MSEYNNTSSGEFVNDIVVNLLGKPISSKEYCKLGGSPNIFCNWVKRNKGVGEQCAFVLSNLVIQEIKFNDRKKKLVLDYLKQYLTTKEKDYMQRNPNDIKTIVGFASAKFSNKNNDPDINKLHRPTESIRIVGLDELFSMGWAIDDFIDGIVGLWKKLIPDMPDEHIGDREKWAKIHMEHSETRKALLNGEDKIVGYYEFDPLFDEIFDKAKEGKLSEGDMSIEDIPFLIPGSYNIYFENICIVSEGKSRAKSVALKKVLYSIINTLEKLALDGVFINEICTWAYTPSGIVLCKSLGLKFHKKHEETGEVYCGTIHDLLSHSICNEFPLLKELYGMI